MDRKLNIFLILIMFLIVPALLFSAEHTGKNDLRQALFVQSGKAIYREVCATCHGVHGDGRGAGGVGFAQPPTDFTKGVYKFRRSTSEFITGAELERSIREGMSGTEMVPFKRILTEKAIAQVVTYLKTFSSKYDNPEAFPAKEEMIEIPRKRSFAPSANSVAKGKEEFADDCSDCHGDAGEGSSDETDEWERPVLMIDFRVGYFKSGKADADLYRSIAAGMPGTTMEAYNKELKPEQIWQLVDYIRSLSKRSDGFFSALVKALFYDEPSGFDYRDY